ncbi:hypothetical protein FVB9288_02077 [Flavobacterium sp. CECT 9288]|nr:hypothetical protein FVB9288_02077 [Flavobacterium sp. CECT 9288]
MSYSFNYNTLTMKINHLIQALFFVFFLSSCSEEKLAGDEFGTIEGKIVSAIDFKPLANVKVFSSPSTSIVFTDEAGKFVLTNVKVGDYSLEAQKEGYLAKFEPAKVNRDQITNIVFELKLSTSNNRPPTATVLTSPMDNAVDQPIELNLNFSATDPDKDVLKYEIILRKNTSNEVTVYKDIAASMYLLKDLAYNTKYFWQVSVSDGINPPVLSPVQTFTTIGFPNARFLFVRKISDNNVIFSGDETGKSVQITTSNTNSWRPRKNISSNKIAFIRSSGAQNHLYTMNPDGSGILKVTNSIPIAGFNSDFINFSWNASGSQLIYPYFDKLYKINADGSGLTKIYQTTNGKFISECDWSNDGTKIALKVNDASGYNTEIFVINAIGTVINQVLSGTQGATGGLNFSVNGQRLLFTRDVSGFEDANYRQLDTKVFQCTLSSNLITDIGLEKPLGTLDLDVRYAPNEAELILMNTSNDGLSIKNIIKYTPATNNVGGSRTLLFSNASMPDWE